MTSLRRRLLVSLLGAIVTVFLVAGVAIYQMAHNEVDEVMDYQLRQLALSLSDQRFGQAAPIAPPEEAFDFVIQIWDGHGLRLYLSHPHSVLPDLAQFGYTTVKAGEDDWRIYSIPLRDRVIQVAQPMRVRRAMAAKAALRTLVPLLVLVPLLGAIIWYLIGRGLRPLDTLARGVTARRADALSPLSDSGVPDEALPLVRALNGLLDRLSQALAAQRAFVADAAHALRTPLTALQLQLQLTERADTAAERQAALSELRGGLTRAIRLVEQLLTLARQSPENDAPAPRTRVDLSALARSALTALGERCHAYTHLSHVYPQGSSVYSTFVFRIGPEFEGAWARWRALKSAVSDAIVRSGGTISHQHGVGKDHAAWLEAEKSARGMQAIGEMIAGFDPDGVMASGNLVPDKKP